MHAETAHHLSPHALDLEVICGIDSVCSSAEALATDQHHLPVRKDLLDGLDVLQSCKAVAAPLQGQVGCWCCRSLGTHDERLPGCIAACSPVAHGSCEAAAAEDCWARVLDGLSAGRSGCAATTHRHVAQLIACHNLGQRNIAVLLFTLRSRPGCVCRTPFQRCRSLLQHGVSGLALSLASAVPHLRQTECCNVRIAASEPSHDAWMGAGRVAGIQTASA